MDNIVYSNLGSRLNKTFKDKRESELSTVKDVIANKWSIQEKSELKTIFINDLKKLLTKENLFDLIEKFFELENDLNTAQEKLFIEEDLINFDEFYKNLSPVLMRAMLDIAQSSTQSDVILASIKESIRIAIEELIYNFEG